MATRKTNASRAVRLPLGRLVATPGAIRALARAGEDPLPFLERHRRGDRGEVQQADRAANDAGRNGNGGQRILSTYRLSDGTPIWIITESDRRATTMLLPEEY